MYTLDKVGYLLKVIKSDPFELLRLFSIGLNTARYRYLQRCVGKGTIVGRHTEIINASRVRIGRGCLLQDVIYIRAGIEGRIVIGDRAALNSFCRIFGHGRVEIGEDTQLGPGSLITTTDHDYRGELETSFKSVIIGKGVWIGANVTVLPGIEIGDYAVIGAGSVVTKNIPPRAVAVGVPARVIKWIDADVKGENRDSNLNGVAGQNDHDDPNLFSR
jgi:UDP-2-acetamido-3-amino-2,3-dideoxy-glucuronate N-acetyltransferase